MAVGTLPVEHELGDLVANGEKLPINVVIGVATTAIAGLVGLDESD